MRKMSQKIMAGVCCLTLFCGIAACGSAEKETIGKNNGPEATVTEAPTKTPEGEMPTKAPEATATTAPTKAPEAAVTVAPTKAPEATVAPTKAPEPEGTIMEAAEKLGFSFGTGASAYGIRDLTYRMMLMDDFNSITATNEMKAYSLLDQKASQWSSDGMPVMNYTQADSIVSLAELLGIGVRGHVLVWDAYMSDWFFREGYTNDGAYVDSETMKIRLQYYIEKVITHFETEFPGVVYCWDVVNEAVGDSPSDYDGSDARHIRTLRSGVKNQFYYIIGPDYVELSFLYAKDTVEKLKKADPNVSITLFYNDYNTFFPEKRDAICALVESINSYAKDANGNYRKLCEGVGMQSYIGGYGVQEGCMNPEDIERIREAVQKYHSLGVEVHVTEMAVRNYDKELEAEHAEFYGKLFEMYAELNSEETLITNISIWGLNDNPWMDENNYSYKMNGPYCGLFDEDYKKKDAYYKVLEALQQAE
ncbi:MAG: endo-1,4-beta-xylanase [Lachnospiraceae bacterium]|nr:endo-1,4-beta-xylanase [Lachnospiraceae bacterium]